jgi:hypothetical protein
MEREKAKLKERGFDGPEYVINPVIEYIDGESKITGRSTTDNLKPFNLTKNQTLEDFDPAMASVEAMIGLMGSGNLDENGQAIIDVSEAISALNVQAQQKSIRNQYKYNDSLDGHSEDWDRAWRSYFHGAARTGAFLKNKKMMDRLRNVATNEFREDFTYQGDENYVENYLKYVNNPAMDWQKMRAANFFWTMGLAPVTAALQYMNLGTTSLAILQQFNANTLENAASLARWWGLSSKFVTWDNIEWRDGSPVVRWDNEEIWAKDIRPAVGDRMTDEQFAEFKEGFLNSFKSGILGAALVEESAAPSMRDELTKMEKGLTAVEKAVQTTGLFIAVAEQHSRVTTHAAILDTMLTNPIAKQRAKTVLAGEDRIEDNPKISETFDAFQKMNPFLSFEQAVAQHGLEESHAVFGKVARPLPFRSWGGAMPFAFMTWPHQVFGTMYRMGFDRGPEGKAALGLLLLTFIMIGGMSGAPGAELLKELYEALHKTLTDEEIDIINNIHDGIGNRFVAETMTHGFLRSLLGVDLAQRTSVSVPGERIALYGMGALDDPSMLGVLGTTIEGVRSGINNARNDAGFFRSAPEFLPVFLANMVKAVGLTQEGAISRKGTQFVAPEDITAFDVGTRFVGMQSAHLSRQREKHWFAQVESKEDQGTYKRHKDRMVNHLTKYYREMEKGNEKKAAKHWDRYDKEIDNLIEFINREGYLIAPADIINSVQNTVTQRLTGEINKKKISKSGLEDVLNLEERIDSWN